MRRRLAPEQAAGDPNADQRLDIYAFGCLAYELLAGVPPFHGLSPQKLLAAHMSQRPRPIHELRPDVPVALVDLVMRCLEKEPDAHPANAEELLRALDSVTTSGAGGSAPSILLGGPARFRRALALYAGAFVVVAAVTKLAIAAIGLADWVFPGAIVAMAAVLPALLFTAYAQRVAKQAYTRTPTYTPGGSPSLTHGALATVALKASPHLSFKRTTRWGMFTLGAFALLVALFMTMRAFGIGPVGSLLATERLPARGRLIITDFGARNTDSSVAAVVAEGVRTDLGESSSIQVLSQTDVADALRRMQQAPNERVTLSFARAIAVREGVPALVDGDVTGLGGGFIVTLRLVTADSGNVLASYQTTVNGPRDLLGGIDAVSRKLRAKIGESLKSVQGSAPLARATTPSLEALKLYTQANRAGVVGDNVGAIALLRQAVTIDSGFALAWLNMASAMRNAGFPEAAVDSASREAYDHRDRLDASEWIAVEGFYFYRGPGRDRARAIAAYERLGARGLNNLAGLFYSQRAFAKADSITTIARRLNPRAPVLYSNAVLSRVNEGRLADAQCIADSLTALNPTYPRLPISRMEIAYAAGNAGLAQRIADTTALSKNLYVRSEALGVGSQLLAAEGRLHDAEAWTLRLASVDSALQIAREPLLDSLDAAVIDGWYHDPPGATEHRIEALLAAMPIERMPEENRPYFAAARVYVIAHRTDRARAMLAAFQRLRDTALVRSMQPVAHQLLGEIALEENRPRDAIVEFRKGDLLPHGPVDSDALRLDIELGRAFDAAGMADSAIVHFERYLTNPNIAQIFTYASFSYANPNLISEDAQYLAGTYKRLGELYETKGDRNKAISYYSRFVELWKHADPELQPTVADVRKRLARLSAREGR